MVCWAASGYVKNMMTGNQYYYKVQWMGKWRYSAGILPALFFVSGVLYVLCTLLLSACNSDTCCISTTEENSLSHIQISE